MYNATNKFCTPNTGSNPTKEGHTHMGSPTYVHMYVHIYVNSRMCVAKFKYLCKIVQKTYDILGKLHPIQSLSTPAARAPKTALSQQATDILECLEIFWPI